VNALFPQAAEAEAKKIEAMKKAAEAEAEAARKAEQEAAKKAEQEAAKKAEEEAAKRAELEAAERAEREAAENAAQEAVHHQKRFMSGDIINFFLIFLIQTCAFNFLFV